ncbi:LysR family transcriptional regulator [Indiicoccus explosivorum]|uniref:LysR family transcriptional regulator n=1 Tax=Indiicoccus explosivorum TaxID=1917864 RepID=UPI000B435020|nr:LysR family transcriptional regulator [Indiicoccus explosivorum]
MELSWLRTFNDAAETLNFRKTSERLLMSQPSVTVQIRLLEEELGVQLFRREKNRVTLTEEGHVFKREVAVILQGLAEGVGRIRSFAQGYRRKWTLAISPLMAETILPYILKEFMADHTELEVAVKIEESVRIEQLVAEGAVSAGISALPPESRNISGFPLYEDPLLFIVPPDAYDDETGPEIEAEEMLKVHRLFIGHHPVFWDELLLKLRKQLLFVQTMQVTQAHIAKRFIQEGLGVSVLPKSTVRRELTEGRVAEARFRLFPLTSVNSYFLCGECGDLEKELISRIQAVHFT